MSIRNVTSCIASTSRAVPNASHRLRPHAPALLRSPILPFRLPQYSTDAPSADAPRTTFPALQILKTSAAAANPFVSPGKPTRLPRNGDIQAPIIRIVNRETGELGPDEPLQAALERLKPNKEFLQLMSLDPPIAKVLAFEDEKKKERLRKEQLKTARKGDKGEKEMQLSWLAQPADMQHKLDKIKEALHEGRRVSVVISCKPKTLPPSDERRAEVEKRIYAATSDLAVESQLPQRGRRHSMLYFRPKSHALDEVEKGQ